MPAVAYNPSDPDQISLLSALALGETGNTPWSAYEGVGGSNISGYATDQYGFPKWPGLGNSHAAGTYQFQPGTWKPYAEKYGLNFQNPADQDAAAWYLAQDTYAQKTGGKSLSEALAKKEYSSIQSALVGVWPSVTGNGAAPKGLAANIAAGIGAVLPGLGGSPSNGAGNAEGGIFGGVQSSVENFFVRFGLIIVGIAIVLVALWMLLADQGVVPSPVDTAKAATKVIAAIA